MVTTNPHRGTKQNFHRLIVFVSARRPLKCAKLSTLQLAKRGPAAVRSHASEQAVKGRFGTVSYAQIQFWRQFCQLLRARGHFCAFSPPVSRGILGAWSLRKIPFAVPHAGFVSKIIDLAKPHVLGLVAGKNMDTGRDTVAGCSRLRSRCGCVSSRPIDGPPVAARDTNRHSFD
jgi:hypothetical protein